MARQSSARHRHHFVPRGYLRNWSSNETHVLGEDIVKRRPPRRISISDICTTRDLYISESHNEPDVMEGIFENLENAALPMVKELNAGRFFRFADRRELFVGFMATQLFRGPDARRVLDKEVLPAVHSILDSAIDLREILPGDGGADVTDRDEQLVRDTLQRSIDNPETKPPKIKNAAYVASAFNAAANLAELLINLPWKLFTFEEHCIATSDAPVSPVGTSLSFDVKSLLVSVDEIVYPIGPHACLTIPSPRHGIESLRSSIDTSRGALDEQTLSLLKEIRNGDRDQWITGSNRDAERLNSITRDGAQQWVISMYEGSAN